MYNMGAIQNSPFIISASFMYAAAMVAARIATRARHYSFVIISAPVSVIRTVCSKWAARLPSRL